jgi:peptidoglycan/xylan/chitin deacetylase (PgdA/CDA1 family)
VTAASAPADTGTTVALPLDEARDARWLQEQWRPPRRGSVNAFYKVKPLIPRRVQVALRRAATRRQRRCRFPAWPYEDGLLRHRRAALETALAARGEARLPVVAPWPEQRRFAFVLTHDVEGPAGIERIPQLLEVERRHGLVSSFNFCGAWYPVADADLEQVRDAGCEVGLHGMEHDGRMFASREAFDRELPRVAEAMAAWGAEGYRSPALNRWGPWMHELPARYDTSFPHSDPFQPQPGGCCAVHPYFFGDVVELPVTLDQDFMLFELLRERTSRLWIEKSRWLIRHHGLVNVIVHPDYLTPERLALYEELLAYLAGRRDGWHALPRDAAAWWRRRSRLRIDERDGTPRVSGADRGGATVAWARPTEDGIAYDTGH